MSQLNRLVAGMLAEYFSDIWVTGEISNLRTYPSGHLYFVLKDKESQIDAVCFRSVAENLKFRLEDGLEVIAHGRAEVYYPRGRYQLVLDRFEPKGVGALQKAFEQLKAKLEKEGLFKPERKKPLPEFIQVLGIVTSPAGAAIRDMLKILRSQGAKPKVVLFPAQVQGEGAAEQIAEGIETLNRWPGIEAIIIGRGGGSIEDLWCFNEELVARAIGRSRVPIISAVGHEVDFTIADFVADVRAPTPTAAAQLVAQGWEKAEVRLEEAKVGLREYMEEILLDRERQLLELIRHRAFEVVCSRLGEAMHTVENMLHKAQTALQEGVAKRASALAQLRERLASRHPAAQLARNRTRLLGMATRLLRQNELNLERCVRRLEVVSGRLDVLSPLASLSRGYAICRREDGSVVKSICQVSSGELVRVLVADGSIGCEVRETAPNPGCYSVTEKEKT